MSYTALYRKFRPQEFTDVKGQDAIVTTLKNQIEADRIGHAYLFCGTRGTGKTTIAKIFAKAVNCEHPIEGSPCGKCDSCRAAAAGTSMNVIEIDAASNNGVENIRQIREEVTYRPTEGRFKVYIIDEVHMLSMGAFNALLKTYFRRYYLRQIRRTAGERGNFGGGKSSPLYCQVCGRCHAGCPKSFGSVHCFLSGRNADL